MIICYLHSSINIKNEYDSTMENYTCKILSIFTKNVISAYILVTCWKYCLRAYIA